MSGPVLELDVGNTAIKWRLLDENGRAAGGRLASVDELSALLVSMPAVTLARIASVASEERNEQLRDLMCRAGVASQFAASQEACGPVRNSYQQVSRMGVDRWLAMVAAYARCGRACLVVDVGTALTIDIVDDQGLHRGGYILPGPVMMAAALVGGTDRVRVANDESPSVVPGVSTEQCVHHAKWLATLGGVREAGLIARAAVSADIVVVVTGGAGQVLCELAGADGLEWQYIEELVLDGLAAVLANEGVGEA